jgi:hypothetical protein
MLRTRQPLAPSGRAFTPIPSIVRRHPIATWLSASVPSVTRRRTDLSSGVGEIAGTSAVLGASRRADLQEAARLRPSDRNGRQRDEGAWR